MQFLRAFAARLRHRAQSPQLLRGDSVLTDEGRGDVRVQQQVCEDVILRDALSHMVVANPGRLRVVHTLSRQSDMSRLPAGLRVGRVSPELLAEVASDAKTAIAQLT